MRASARPRETFALPRLAVAAILGHGRASGRKHRHRLGELKRQGSRHGAIQIVGLNKWFGAFHVLKNINLAVRKGEKIVICGPSGSGKSTLIRCINRLETHQDGRIVVDGMELTNDLRQIDKVRAEVGMVFQSFNLFPHLTVLDNLCLGSGVGEENAARARPRRWRASIWSGCASPSRPTSIRDSFRAASSSVSPSRAPCA